MAIYVQDSFEAHHEASLTHKDIVSLKVREQWVRGKGVRYIATGKTVDGIRFQRTYWKDPIL